ncbi:Bug family tripartite tricarboxylate transporter substrate binding protein [Piscinibacter koreensis]|uniref:Tripartite tricarboxylate transporter substrate binding protein n=1 Tax=Piscinibacter koreensis TaxID=2742824 RepID=A0A7Y6TXN1_9BURK|nr:tripartite tricarboxylate transporter substrate binding protein [Schlegelella koreensis]NUZ07309.1 tripartite tricarboxylate transporter substrate binding protein [Schlegelella koreensis]
MNRRNLLIAAAALAAVTGASAQSYPTKPIRILAGAPPGGAFDMMARLVAEGLQKATGQSVIVENRSGAGGTIAVDAAARSAPDGYTLVVGSTGPFAVSPSLIKKLPYDPVKDFVPIARLSLMPSYLVVNGNVPASNVKEFLAYAKANPGKLTYASTGNGLSQHTNVELLKNMAGIFILPVTYRGSAPAVTDLLGGQVDLMIELGPQAIPHIKSGKLKVLATTTAKRTEAMPEVPTLAESGVPGYEAFTWFALYAPAGTPADVVARIHAETVKYFNQPDVKARLAAAGAEVATTSGDELARFQAAETKKWAEVIQRAGIKPE